MAHSNAKTRSNATNCLAVTKVLTLPEVLETLACILTDDTKRQWECFTNGNTWAGGVNFDECVNRVQYGWRNAPEIRHMTIPSIVAMADDTAYYYDVTGDTLDVAAYVSGEPEHWLQSTSVRVETSKIIRLAVDVSIPGIIEADQIANRGAAMVALVNSLELAGCSVELAITIGIQTPKDNRYSVLFPIKSAGDALNMPRVQFMIGHTSFFRRCIFGLLEQLTGEMTGPSIPVGYAPEGYTHVSSTDGLYSNESDAMEWAEKFAHELAA
jgi:hypothetical protein